MSRRLILFIIVLLFSALACNTSGVTNIPAPSQPSNLDTVDISPSIGTPPFRVLVAYFWNRADPNFSIICTHPGTLGGDTIQVPLTLNHTDTSTSFEFRVTEPGSYNVNCRDSFGNSVTAVFTVEAAATSQSQQPTGVATSRARLVTGTGTWTVNYTDPTGTCTEPASRVELQLADDGTGTLKVYYPTITGAGSPCTYSSDTSVYNLGTGAVDWTLQKVSFTTCGPYTAKGEVSFKAGTLVGDITCFDTGAGLTSSRVLNMP